MNHSKSKTTTLSRPSPTTTIILQHTSHQVNMNKRTLIILTNNNLTKATEVQQLELVIRNKVNIFQTSVSFKLNLVKPITLATEEHPHQDTTKRELTLRTQSLEGIMRGTQRMISLTRCTLLLVNLCQERRTASLSLLRGKIAKFRR